MIITTWGGSLIALANMSSLPPTITPSSPLSKDKTSMSGGASLSLILHFFFFFLLCWGSDCVQSQAGFGLAAWVTPRFWQKFGLAGYSSSAADRIYSHRNQ